MYLAISIFVFSVVNNQLTSVAANDTTTKTTSTNTDKTSTVSTTTDFTSSDLTTKLLTTKYLSTTTDSPILPPSDLNPTDNSNTDLNIKISISSDYIHDSGTTVTISNSIVIVDNTSYSRILLDPEVTFKGLKSKVFHIFKFFLYFLLTIIFVCFFTHKPFTDSRNSPKNIIC